MLKIIALAIAMVLCLELMAAKRSFGGLYASDGALSPLEQRLSQGNGDISGSRVNNARRASSDAATKITYSAVVKTGCGGCCKSQCEPVCKKVTCCKKKTTTTVVSCEGSCSKCSKRTSKCVQKSSK